MQYLYKQGDDYYFMDTRNYEQTFLGEKVLGDSKNYLKENINASMLFYNGKAHRRVAAQLGGPEGHEVRPGHPRRHRERARMKPATLETGYVVNVPLFINEGDVLKIDTRDGKYLTRVATAADHGEQEARLGRDSTHATRARRPPARRGGAPANRRDARDLGGHPALLAARDGAAAHPPRARPGARSSTSRPAAASPARCPRCSRCRSRAPAVCAGRPRPRPAAAAAPGRDEKGPRGDLALRRHLLSLARARTSRPSSRWARW